MSKEFFNTIHAIATTARNHEEVVSEVLLHWGVPTSLPLEDAASYVDEQEAEEGRTPEELLAQINYVRSAAEAAGVASSLLANLDPDCLGLTDRTPVPPVTRSQEEEFLRLAADLPLMRLGFHLALRMNLDAERVFKARLSRLDDWRIWLSRAVQGRTHRTHTLPTVFHSDKALVAINEAVELVFEVQALFPGFYTTDEADPDPWELNLWQFRELCQRSGFTAESLKGRYARDAYAAYARDGLCESEGLREVSRDLGLGGYCTQWLKATYLKG